jgi:single-strand DNA-binding protein
VAEIAGKYLAKGKQCYIAGRMSTREWTDKDGQKRYTTEINVDRLQLLGSKDDGERNEQPRQAPAKPKPAPSFDDDIPW